MGIHCLYTVFFIENKMEFKIRGLTGDENATIAIPGKATQALGISREWKTYSITLPVEMSFMLAVASPLDQELFFKPAFDYEIQYVDEWDIWKCGNEAEDSRCDEVRRGKFAWSGSYNLTYIIRGMLRLESRA